MTKEEINFFSKRIAQANKTELVVITYEIMINYVDSATVELSKGNTEGFVDNLKKTKRFLDDLTTSLRFNSSISYDLLSLYRFADKCIIKSISKRDDCDIDAVRNMLVKLHGSFEKISQEDSSATVMKNSSQVYAGLTYGKNSINEVVNPGVTYN